ncbi:hypothetical protein ABZ312_23680 [Streptomyces sp. NPDC006207]
MLDTTTDDLLTPEQARAVIGSATTAEETALAELALRVGLRGREVLDLVLTDDPAELLTVVYRFHERRIAIAPTAARAVAAQAQAAGVGPGERLFPGMAEVQLVQLVHRLCTAAGVLFVPLPVLRRTAISSALDWEISLMDAQAYFGFAVDGVLPDLQPGADVRIAAILDDMYRD